MEISGKIKVVLDEKTFSSGFTKREFVITTEEQYPNDIMFELLKEKGALITQFAVGDRITVHFDVRGREWQGKYFNSLVAWRIEGQKTPSDTPQPQNQAAPAPANFTEPADDDLPF
jgi:hypothetical protein